MKTLFLIRFDKSPREEVSEILTKHSIEEEKPYVISTPSTQITLFKTEDNLTEIHTELREIYPPVAFFLIDVSDTDVIINMHESVLKPLRKFLGSGQVEIKYQDLNVVDLQKILNEAMYNEEYELCAHIQKIINSKS